MKRLASLLFLITVSACQTTPAVTPSAPVKPKLPAVAPLVLESGVEWTLVRTSDGVWVALSPENYEKLVRNDVAKAKWISAAQQQLEYYGGQ